MHKLLQQNALGYYVFYSRRWLFHPSAKEDNLLTGMSIWRWAKEWGKVTQDRDVKDLLLKYSN